MAWSDNWEKAKPAQKPRPRTRRVVVAVSAVVIAVVVGVVLFFVLSNGKEEPTPVEKVVKKPKVVKKAKPLVASRVAKPTPVPAPVADPVPPPTETDPAKRIVAVLSCTTNEAFGQICEIYRTADGKTHRNYRRARPPLFKHATDQLLAMALCHNPRVPMPPMPVMSIGGHDLDKRFLESLKEPIIIGSDDSEEDVKRKKVVMDARERVKELLDQGHHFDEILSEHRALLNENVKIRNEAMRELNKIHASGDVEGERKFTVAINAALQQMGIEELDAPKTREERLAEREARRAEREKQQKEQK